MFTVFVVVMVAGQVFPGDANIRVNVAFWGYRHSRSQSNCSVLLLLAHQILSILTLNGIFGNVFGKSIQCQWLTVSLMSG